MKEYKVIQAETAELFEAYQNQLARHGWTPAGPVVIDTAISEVRRDFREDGAQVDYYYSRSEYFQSWERETSWKDDASKMNEIKRIFETLDFIDEDAEQWIDRIHKIIYGKDEDPIDGPCEYTDGLINYLNGLNKGRLIQVIKQDTEGFVLAMNLEFKKKAEGRKIHLIPPAIMELNDFVRKNMGLDEDRLRDGIIDIYKRFVGKLSKNE